MDVWIINLSFRYEVAGTYAGMAGMQATNSESGAIY
jgi:hypothetical protein